MKKPMQVNSKQYEQMTRKVEASIAANADGFDHQAVVVARVCASGLELLALVERAQEYMSAIPYDGAQKWVADADTLIRHCRRGDAK